MATPDPLQDALDDCNLDHWISKTQAARQPLRRGPPLSIPKRTLNNEAELKAWLAEVEQLLAEKLKSGPVAL